jgi:chromosome partitioning protein
LAVANQKGGVAKTTTVASLGAAFTEAGQRVLLVDLDPQGCLSFSLGTDPDKLPVSIHDVLLGDVEPDAALVQTPEGMTLLPANIDLAGAEAMLLMRAGREYALRRALAKLADHDFDVVIIDCPPSLGVLTLNGLTAADDVIGRAYELGPNDSGCAEHSRMALSSSAAPRAVQLAGCE